MSGELLLGIDEGTTGVKAALFDGALKPVARGAARQGQPLSAARLGRAGRRGGARPPWWRRSPSCSPTPRGRWSPAGSTTRASRCSPGTPRAAQPLSPIVVWQDKRSQEVLDRLADGEEEVKEASGLPYDPYFSAAKLAWLLEHADGVAARARRRHPADGHGRLVPLRSPRSRLRHRPVHRVPDPAAAHRRRPGFDPALCEIFGVPLEVLPEVRDTAGELGTLRSPELAGRAAAVRPDRRPAGGARRIGRRRPGPCEGHLRHRGLRARARRRGGAAARPAGCCRRSLGGSPGASSTRSTVACSRPARCSSGSAASSASPPTRPRSASSPARPRTPAARRCCPGWRGSAPRGGARTHARCSPGSPAARPGRRSRARRSRGSPGGSPTSSRRSARASTSNSLRVDGGVTNEPLMLELQADAIGAPVEARAPTRPCSAPRPWRRSARA